MTEKSGQDGMSVVTQELCRRHCRIILFAGVIAWLFSLPSVALSQEPLLQFEHMTVRNSFPTNFIWSVLQDRKGFMWYGTNQGLIKYDGRNSTVYKFPQHYPRSIRHNWVRCVYEDQEGVLWVGTDEGLYEFDRTSETFTRFAKDSGDGTGLSNGHVRCILQDRRGVFWIGTADGLNRFDPATKKFKHYEARVEDSSSLGHPSVGVVYEDRSGTLWIGTGDNEIGGAGLHKFDPVSEVFKRYTHDSTDHSSISNNWITSIEEDHLGQIWVGTDYGLNRFDRTRGRFVRYMPDPQRKGSMTGLYIKAILEDESQVLWIGTWRSGLFRLNRESGEFTQFQRDTANPATLHSNHVFALFEDRTGVLWIGTWGGGVNRLVRGEGPFLRSHRRVPDVAPLALGLVGTLVSSVCEDSATIWVGTSSKGLIRYDRQKAAGIDTLLRNAGVIECIYRDRSGILWIGSNLGLFALDRARVNLRKFDEDSPNEGLSAAVTSVLEDRAGELWVGTARSGLKRLDRQGQRLTTQTNHPRLADCTVYAFLEDSAGSLWIGTNRGLFRIRSDDGFTHFEHRRDDPATLSSDQVLSLFEDRAGVVWIGTDKGLNRVENGSRSFKHFGEREGFRNSTICAILQDDRGYLWISTLQGLVKMNPATGVVHSYGVDDGLAGEGFVARSSILTSRGEIMFGRLGGLTVFHPDSLLGSLIVPPVVISKFTVFDDERKAQAHSFPIETVELSHDENFFSLEFSVLDFRRPEQNAFIYRLDGFDRDWNYAGRRAYASYTNVDPGTYILKLKGSNSLGVWNEAGAQLQIIIHPAFWQTWWFGMLVSFVVASGVWGAYRFRVRQIVQMERLRLRIASDLHDELASNLTSIAMFGKILQDESTGEAAQDGHRLQLLDRITQLSQGSVTSIREIIWALDTRVETLESLLLRVKDMSVVACRAKSVECIVDVPTGGRLPHNNLRPEVRQHLWLFFKEAVNNALKHSRCGVLKIAVHYLNQFLYIRIQDDGVGFNERGHAKGKGLSTMKMRADELGGKLELSSHEGKGTSLTLTLKITDGGRWIYTGGMSRFWSLGFIRKYFGI